MINCIYDVSKYGSCMIDDWLFDMLDDNSFEMIFWNYSHSLKRIVLTVLLRLFTFRYQVSTISESNFWCSSVWYDIWLSFANEQEKIFVHKIIFVRRTPDILLTKIPYNLYFFVHSFFTQGLVPILALK